jgi:hypothetical protein
MNQKGHLVKKNDLIAYGVKLKVGLAKAGDASSIPVQEIPIEKDEPLKLELLQGGARPGDVVRSLVGCEPKRLVKESVRLGVV